MKNILAAISAVAVLSFSSLAFAGWEPVSGYSGGSLNGKSSPVEAVAWKFTVENANTVTNLPLTDVGGCITSSWVDMGASAPNPLTVTLYNSAGLPVTDLSSKSLTGDGWLKENDGTVICFAKGFYFSFTTTAAVGANFTIVNELLVNSR